VSQSKLLAVPQEPEKIAGAVTSRDDQDLFDLRGSCNATVVRRVLRIPVVTYLAVAWWVGTVAKKAKTSVCALND